MRVSRNLIASLILVLALACPGWAATYTGNQGGADLILANGDYIHGSISNVRKFKVPAGATVYVTPWNGGQYGQVEVTAGEIEVAGTIDASRAGYFGYAGGGGGGGGETKSHGGAAGGPGGGREGAAQSGGSSTSACDCSGYCGGPGGSPGTDSYSGKGPYGGSRGTAGGGGLNGSAGGPGGPGGYGGYGLNGDASTDETIRPGSGGGGGGGGGGSGGGTGTCNGCGGAGGGGGASGGRGGGAVKLVARHSLVITGSILAKGGQGLGGLPGNPRVDSRAGRPGGSGAAVTSTSGSGLGGAAAQGAPAGCGNNSSTYYSGAGGKGGPGAGGGVLLKCTGPWPLRVSGVIDTRGGEDNTTNFGSLKIFGVEGKVDISGATVYAGWNNVYGTPHVSRGQHFLHPLF